MASIKLGGNPINTLGSLPSNGNQAPTFQLVNTELETVSLDDYKGHNVILNIFPSIDTGVCSTSVRTFNKKAAGLENTKVLCISRDLPFAHKRFCAAEGIENVESLSDFIDGSFGKDYHLEITDGAFKGLHSRAVIVLDKNGKVVYSEQVPEIGQEPNYEAAIEAVK